MCPRRRGRGFVGGGPCKLGFTRVQASDDAGVTVQLFGDKLTNEPAHKLGDQAAQLVFDERFKGR